MSEGLSSSEHMQGNVNKHFKSLQAQGDFEGSTYIESDAEGGYFWTFRNAKDQLVKAQSNSRTRLSHDGPEPEILKEKVSSLKNPDSEQERIFGSNRPPKTVEELEAEENPGAVLRWLSAGHYIQESR
jgi:hypothetical protein